MFFFQIHQIKIINFHIHNVKAQCFQKVPLKISISKFFLPTTPPQFKWSGPKNNKNLIGINDKEVKLSN